MKEIPGSDMQLSPLWLHWDRSRAAHIQPQDMEWMPIIMVSWPLHRCTQNQDRWEASGRSTRAPPAHSPWGGLGNARKACICYGVYLALEKDPVPQDLGCAEGPSGCQLLPIQ
jgi:hypothetical protein